ncbi:MAG: hypothetical protein QM698_00565 [Micropepsaceae bacterium]
MNPTRRFTAAALAAAMSITSVAGIARAEEADPYMLFPGSLGPVKVGMTVDEAVKALGSGWSYRGMMDDGDMTCGHISREGLWPDGSPYFMAQDGVVTRIEFSNASILTEKGIHVGSTEAEVKAAYGRQVQAEPHQYQAAPAQYLTVWFQNAPKEGDYAEDRKARGIKFETNEQRIVIGIYAGDTSIMYVEGCA